MEDTFNFRSLSFILMVFCICLIFGCSKEKAVDDPVMCTTNVGQILASDVLLESQNISSDERRLRKKQKKFMHQSWAEWAKRIALRDIVENKYPNVIDETPVLKESIRRAQRDWVFSYLKDKCFGYPSNMPSDVELAKMVDEDSRELPERIRLHHIFLRGKTEEELVEAEKKLSQFKSEIKTVKDFEEFARKHSDSETAQKGGRLGSVHQGWLPKEAEEIIFSLPENEMSPPIRLKGGVHIFYVGKKVQPQQNRKVRKIAKLKKQKLKEAIKECKKKKLEDLGADPDKIGKGWSDLSVGDWTITKEILKKVYKRKGVRPKVVRRQIYYRELIYQSFLKTGNIDQRVKLRLKDISRDQVVNWAVEKAVKEQLKPPTKEQLLAKYENSPKRFRSPLKMEVTGLVTELPKDKDPFTFITEMEELSGLLQEKKINWKQAQKRISGQSKLVNYPMTKAKELIEMLSPLVFEQLKKQPVGQVGEPIRDMSNVMILQVVAKEKPQRLPFEAAKPRIESLMKKSMRKQLFNKVTLDLLKEGEFRFTPDGQKVLDKLAREESR